MNVVLKFKGSSVILMNYTDENNLTLLDPIMQEIYCKVFKLKKRPYLFAIFRIREEG